MSKLRICFSAIIWISMVYLTGCQRVLDLPVGAVEIQEGIPASINTINQYEITAADCDTAGTDGISIDLNALKGGMDGIYAYDDRVLHIYTAGDYLISGKLDDGSLHINAFEDEIVHLVLQNVEINSRDGAAIYIENASKVVITASEGSENILSANSRQGGTRQACIFSNSDLTVNGEGSLAVYSYHADGARSKDVLKVVNTNLFVKAREDGIRGNDGVILYNSITEVNCEGTGIFSNSDKDMVVLQGGQCKVIAGENAITANQMVSIHDTLPDLYSILDKIRCDGLLELDDHLGF